MALYPSVNDRDYDLLKKIAYNAGIIADSGGGGGGGSYSTAANYSSLPPAGLFSGTTYLVLAAQGVYFVSRKPAGLYRSDGASWVYMADATEAYFQDTLAWSNITSKPSTFTPSAHAANHSSGGSDPVTITNLAGFPGGGTTFLRDDGTFAAAGGGSGDVVGPAASVDDRIATFDGLTGKLIQDGGKTIAGVLGDAATDATTKANAAQAAAIAASQPLDGDLTAIAALTPSNDDIIQRKAGAWTNRTIAQLIADLSLTSSSVGLGNVTNDAQTKAAIVPNTAPAAGEILVGNAGGTAYAKQALTGPVSITSAGLTAIAVATTSAIGGAPQATAPASGLLSVLAIGNGETVRTDKPLFDTTTPAALGVAAAGTQLIAARRDHVHAMPSASDVGLGNVTNDVQTKNSIVPNTAPSAGDILIGNAGGTAYAKNAMSGDATMTSGGVVALAASKKNKIIGITIDGSGTAIATGVKGYVRFPLAGTITKVTVLADQTGSIVIDVWKDTYANFPPTDADSITSAAPPTITTAIKSEDSTLTGWTTAVSAGDCLGFNVDSCTSITRVTLEIEVTLT